MSAAETEAPGCSHRNSRSPVDSWDFSPLPSHRVPLPTSFFLEVGLSIDYFRHRRAGIIAPASKQSSLHRRRGAWTSVTPWLLEADATVVAADDICWTLRRGLVSPASDGVGCARARACLCLPLTPSARLLNFEPHGSRLGLSNKATIGMKSSSEHEVTTSVLLEHHLRPFRISDVAPHHREAQQRHSSRSGPALLIVWVRL